LDIPHRLHNLKFLLHFDYGTEMSTLLTLRPNIASILDFAEGGAMIVEAVRTENY